MPTEPETLIETAENMPLSRDSLWSKRLVQETIAFLMTLGMLTKGEKCVNVAQALTVVRDGFAVPLHNCESCLDVAARYPVICENCAQSLVAVTPQKMVLRLINPQVTATDPFIWAAAYFSFAFIPNRMQRPNTLEECERILDDLNSEEAVSALIETLEAAEPTKEEVERGN